MRNITAILSHDLPVSVVEIQKTGEEIHKTANYCQESYIRSRNKKQFVDETLNFAADSFCKMAQRIHVMSNNFLVALDQQTQILDELNESTNRLKLFVNAHKEKVARKAIGSCAVEKCQVTYSHEFQPEIPQKYIRRPIDYTVFDGIGFGSSAITEPAHSSNAAPAGLITRRCSAAVPSAYDRQSSHMQSHTVGPKSGSEYAASSIYNASKLQTGTLGRSMGIYRAGPIQQPQPLPDQISRKSSNSSADVAGYASRNAIMNTSQQQHQQAIYVSNNNTNGQVPANNKSSPSHPQQPMKPQPPPQQQFVFQSVPVGAQQAASMGPAAASKMFVLQQQQQQQQQVGINQQGQPIMLVRQQSDMTQNQTLAMMPNNRTAPGTMNMQQMQRQMSLNYAHQQGGGGILVGRPPQDTTLVVQDMAKMSLQQPQQQQVMRMQGGGMIYAADMGRKLSQQHQPGQMIVMDPNCVGLDHNQQSGPSAMLVAQANQVQQNNNPGNVMVYQQAQVAAAAPPSQQLGMVAKKPNDAAWAPNFYLEKVETLYEYFKDRHDELTFKEGQTIYVIKKNEDGWWEGIMNGTTGLFPGNYVQPAN